MCSDMYRLMLSHPLEKNQSITSESIFKQENIFDRLVSEKISFSYIQYVYI